MSKTNARQGVLENDKNVAPPNDADKWSKAIKDASLLLLRVESRAARLRGAIKTFTELRDLGAEFSGPKSPEEI